MMCQRRESPSPPASRPLFTRGVALLPRAFVSLSQHSEDGERCANGDSAPDAAASPVYLSMPQVRSQPLHFSCSVLPPRQRARPTAWVRCYTDGDATRSTICTLPDDLAEVGTEAAAMPWPRPQVQVRAGSPSYGAWSPDGKLLACTVMDRTGVLSSTYTATAGLVS